MMRMGFLFPGMGGFFGILLVSIVVLALLFGANSLRGRTRLNRKNPRSCDRCHSDGCRIGPGPPALPNGSHR